MSNLDLAIAQITGYKEAKKGTSIEDLFDSLDLAIAQIIGYKEAKKGTSIEDLFDSMGLTENEWKKIKNIDCVNCLFNLDEFSLIRDYFYKKQSEIKQ